MADLTLVQVARGGTVYTYESAAADGDAFINDGKTILAINNGSGTSITVTVATAGQVEGLAIDDVAIVVAAGALVMAGPFSRTVFNDSTGKVQLTYSDVTSLGVKAFKVNV